MSQQELLLVLTSALLHAVWSAAVKGSRSPLAFNLLQTVMSLPLSLVVLGYAGLGTLPAELWPILAVSCVVHAFYAYWMARAYEGGDLSVVYPIFRSTPALLPFVAVPLLGDSISLAGALGIATVVAGVWLVHTQGLLRWRALAQPGTGFAYLTLLATVGYSLADKAAMAELSSGAWQSPLPRSVVYFFLLLTGHGLCLIPLVLRRMPVREVARLARVEPSRILAAALGSFFSYALILEALRTASVSYVVAVRQMSVLFAVAISMLWLKEQPGRTRVMGAIATVAGVAVIALAA